MLDPAKQHRVAVESGRAHGLALAREVISTFGEIMSTEESEAIAAALRAEIVARVVDLWASGMRTSHAISWGTECVTVLRESLGDLGLRLEGLEEAIDLDPRRPSNLLHRGR